MCDLGQLVGRTQVFTAARGFGKTSLLREIERRAQARGAVSAWVTAGEEQGLIPAVVDSFREATSSWRDSSRLLPVLEQARVVVNLGVASAEATVRPRPVSDSPSGARALEQLLREVVTTGRGHGTRAAAVFVDEVQAADRGGLRILAYALQHLQAEGLDVPVGVFAAGLPDSADVIIEAVSSAERFAYDDLGPLSGNAVVRALVDPARALGVMWEPAALQAAVSACAGYPFTVQLVADHAWQVAGHPVSGSTITAAHAEQACGLAMREMAQLIEGRFNRSSSAERLFMTAMASLGDAAGSSRRSCRCSGCHLDAGVQTARQSAQGWADPLVVLRDGRVHHPGHGRISSRPCRVRPTPWLGVHQVWVGSAAQARREASASPDAPPRPSPQHDRGNDLGR